MSPALGPNQAPTQYVWRAIYRGLKWPGLRKHLRSHLTAKNTKIFMYKVLIRPVLTYASETWTLSKTNERRLSLFERKVLRCIFGAKQENGTWRKRYNCGLYEIFKEPNIVNYIKLKRLA